jgi:hypothetical protein
MFSRAQRPIGAARRAVGLALLAVLLGLPGRGHAQAVEPVEAGPDLDLEDATVAHDPDLDLLIFEQAVAGTAGGTVPEAAGSFDTAPVLAYVFPTTLSPTAVGFRGTDGVLALVVTSHPDFDDTPLWDENGDGDYGNDGRVYHTHWVSLVRDDRVEGGWAVAEYREADAGVARPPTSPDVPLFLDSPGFDVGLDGAVLQVRVPTSRVSGRTDFRFDAMTAYLEVNTSDSDRPTLGVYRVYSLLSGDLSLPYGVEEAR